MIEGRKICVVIPEWNELGDAISRAEQILREVSIIDEVIIVDDGSADYRPDRTYPHKIRVLGNNVNRGVGYSFVRGINYALAQNYDFLICWTLIDRGLCSDDFRAIITKLLDFDFVPGFRKGFGGEKMVRRAGMFVHNILFFANTRTWLKDTTIGMRGFRRSVFDKVNLPGNKFMEQEADSKKWQWFWRYGFETWILLEALKKKLRISPCPITVDKARNSSIRLRGRNSFLSIYAPFFKNPTF